MKVISADDIACSATPNVDAVSIVEFLHDVVDLVVFDAVVVAV